MPRPKLNVTVALKMSGEVCYSSGDVNTAWATDVKVDKRGALHVYEGWNQRVFHPAGEWLSYTVAVAPTPTFVMEQVDDGRGRV